MSRPTAPRTELVIDGLRAGLGAAVVDDPDIVAAYRRDQSQLTPCGNPLVLVRARSVDDVIATMKTAHAQRIPVVTRGAGTGLSGGANALDGCIVLSTERLNRIVHIDVDARLVDPGLTDGRPPSAG
ncbi:FAD-binding oxidoreductase [Gordonia sp. TBRC 11910]|uniref:FAD-binding oxidoreductase n=1 Tax=Gordonia asplenii TaxID=2725283 RepID=A0A848KTB2_9ACTN|nr:FAD-binding oxidoreductase [Gordonia asplenii]